MLDVLLEIIVYESAVSSVYCTVSGLEPGNGAAVPGAPIPSIVHAECEWRASYVQ